VPPALAATRSPAVLQQLASMMGRYGGPLQLSPAGWVSLAALEEPEALQRLRDVDMFLGPLIQVRGSACILHISRPHAGWLWVGQGQWAAAEKSRHPVTG
jgi:hypothetical protein